MSTETMIKTERSAGHGGKLWASLSRYNARRSLILFAAGAILGLGLAAYGLFTAQGTRTSAVPPEDIALINGRHILRTDFIAQTEIETALPFDKTTEAQREKVLNEMINEELLVQRGLEIDLAASDPDVRTALVNGVDLQVDADVASEQPSDQQLMAYYNAHKAKYAGEGVMQMRDFFLRPTATMTPADEANIIQAALKELQAGADPDAVAKKYKLQDSMLLDHGDNFDFAARIKLGPEIYNKAAALKGGQVSKPFVLAGNVHIVVMLKRLPPVQRTFAQARDTVLQDYKKEATDRIEQANLKYLKSKADILLAPEFSK